MCIAYWSSYYNIDHNLVHAIVKTESNYVINPKVNTKEYSYGLMQIRSRFVKYTPKQLVKPCLNIRTGVRILNDMRNSCPFNKNYSYVICYNRGVKGSRLVRNPIKDRYYQTVIKHYRRRTEKHRRLKL